MSARLTRMLPASLGSLFCQPAEPVAIKQARVPAAEIAGAYNAPELCQLVDQYSAACVASDSAVEVKLDGLRCLGIGQQIVTREGSPFEAAFHCAGILADLAGAFGRPMFFDGEYIEDGGLEATQAAFRSRKGAGCLWLFDAVPLEEWQSGRPSSQTLQVRKGLLRAALAAVNLGRPSSPVGYIEHTPTVGAAQVERFANDLWRQGHEGLVVKRLGSRYVRRRAAEWMKVKQRTVSPMIVVDVLGTNKGGEETARALLVRLQHPQARPIRVAVGGDWAAAVWRYRETMIGQPVDVEHSGFTGAGNPREAQLKRISI